MAEKIDWLEDKYSASKCGTISRCLRKAYYKYVMRMKEPANPAIMFGRGVHEGMEHDNHAKVRGEALPLEAVHEAGVEGMKEAAQKEGIKADVDRFAQEYEAQLEKYEESGIRESVRPVEGSVEGAFQIEANVGDPEHGLKPALIEGYVDVISQGEDGKRTLVDYKSAGKPMSQREADEHTQLALEAIGAGAEQAQIVSFVKHQKQKPTCKATQPVPATKDRFDKAIAICADAIHAFRRALKTGDFPKCEPTAFYCQHGKGCAYGHLCYPEQATDQAEYVQVTKIVPVGVLPPAEWREGLAGSRARARKEAQQK